MTYAEFQRYMANYGFVQTPMNENCFNKCKHLPIDTIYGIACDMNAGLSFVEAFYVNENALIEEETGK